MYCSMAISRPRPSASALAYEAYERGMMMYEKVTTGKMVCTGLDEFTAAFSSVTRFQAAVVSVGHGMEDGRELTSVATPLWM